MFGHTGFPEWGRVDVWTGAGVYIVSDEGRTPGGKIGHSEILGVHRPNWHRIVSIYHVTVLALRWLLTRTQGQVQYPELSTRSESDAAPQIGHEFREV
jgi:hypothetical protein